MSADPTGSADFSYADAADRNPLPDAEIYNKLLYVNDTEDQLFLLSYAESNRYMGVTYEDKTNIQSRVAPTAYALARGAYVDNRYKTAEDEGAGQWWLRSPGGNPMYAAIVFCNGALVASPVRGTCGGVVVRPAFWFNLKSDMH